MDAEIKLLSELPTADLHTLRLAAQVMRHRAELEPRAHVADYFARLEIASTGELAARGELFRVIPAAARLGLDPSADAEDRRVLGEYLTLLVANERLSPALRQLSRTLRARHCR